LEQDRDCCDLELHRFPEQYADPKQAIENVIRIVSSEKPKKMLWFHYQWFIFANWSENGPKQIKGIAFLP